MMKKMLFIENLMHEKTSQLNDAVAMASTKGLKLSALFIIPLHPDVADWVEVREKQMQKAEEEVTAYGQRMASELEEKGLDFHWRIVMGSSDAIMEAISEFMPADIILTGKLDFETLASKGIHNLEELSGWIHCPVLPVERLVVDEAPKAKFNLLRFLIFGGLSAAIYIFFFPMIDQLNHSLFMKGTVLGGIAVMVVVALHAYIYGSFTEYLPRFLGLDKGKQGH